MLHGQRRSARSPTAPPATLHDYVLPNVRTRVLHSGVFDPRRPAVNGFPTSDHRLVRADPRLR
jgi:hypothetical protein